MARSYREKNPYWRVGNFPCSDGVTCLELNLRLFAQDAASTLIPRRVAVSIKWWALWGSGGFWRTWHYPCRHGRRCDDWICYRRINV